MIATDPLKRADRAEEIQARLALRRTRNNDELAAAWMVNAEHFTGEARVRLQAIFSQKMREFGALHG